MSCIENYTYVIKKTASGDVNSCNIMEDTLKLPYSGNLLSKFYQIVHFYLENIDINYSSRYTCKKTICLFLVLYKENLTNLSIGSVWEILVALYKLWLKMIITNHTNKQIINIHPKLVILAWTYTYFDLHNFILSCSLILLFKQHTLQR